jgi:hypothetical protein
MARKRRKFTREAWQKLMETVRHEKQMEQPEPARQDKGIEIHVHNYPIQPEFDKGANSADHDLERLRDPNGRRRLL